jgi:hypothetical protein
MPLATTWSKEASIRAQAALRLLELDARRQELPKEQWVVRRHSSGPGKMRIARPPAAFQTHIVKARSSQAFGWPAHTNADCTQSLLPPSLFGKSMSR